MQEKLENYNIMLMIAEGVPILQLYGQLSADSVAAIKKALIKLADAGHYNVIIDLNKVKSTDWSLLAKLKDVIKFIKGHYGTVDIIVNMELYKQIAKNNSYFEEMRVSSSVNHAICRIKRLMRQPEFVSHINARLLEMT